MISEYYVPVIGTILRIAPMEGNCCGYLITLKNEDGQGGTTQFMLTGETVVIDSQRLYPGMRAAMFYDTRLPMQLIFPPRYQAQLIAVLNREEQVLLSYFDVNLVASGQKLSLNIGRNTRITTLNGQNFRCELADKELLVYYTVTTKSIPPRTTPRKIIAIC